MLTPPRALCAPPLTQEGRTTKQFMLSPFLSLVSVLGLCLLVSVFSFCLWFLSLVSVLGFCLLVSVFGLCLQFLSLVSVFSFCLWFLSLVSVFSFCSCSCFCLCLQFFIPSSEKRGACLKGTWGVLNSINASLLTLVLPLPLPLSLPLVGDPVGRDMKKVVFCIIRHLTSACLRHDFYVMPSSEALQKTTFFMPVPCITGSGGSFSLGYLFFWTSKRKGTT